MNRRQFLKITGGGIALAASLEPLAIAAEKGATTGGVRGNGSEADIRSLFEASNENVLALWARGSRRRHLRQDHRQRDQERDQ